MSGSEPQWTFSHKFYLDFNAAASELTSRLNTLKGSHDLSSATLQNITSDLSRLTKSLSDATGSLPSYDQRQCELQLKTLEKSIEELRGASTGAPIFSFKRKAAKTKPPVECRSVVDPPASNPTTTLICSTKTLAAFSRRYLTILDVCSLSPSADFSISDLDNCIVNLLPSNEDHAEITAFYVQRISRSIILLPRITGSIIIHGLKGCAIVVGCHQFRMHDSTAVDVYLDCLSDPIIEHCSGIRFASYPSDLVDGEPLQDGKDFSVKDFSHILPTPSPNWSSLRDGTEASWPIISLQGQTLQEEIERVLSTSGR